MMDYCGCGSIKDVMKKTKETLNEPQLSFVCAETLKGLIYLHNMKIIHHDIKAGNLLLTERGEVKLADFGVAQQYNTDSAQAADYIGSPLYMSPEVLKKTVYTANVSFLFLFFSFLFFIFFFFIVFNYPIFKLLFFVKCYF